MGLFSFFAWAWRLLSKRPWALIVVGLVLLAAAPLYYAGSEPVCGGQTMQPGDQCESGSGAVTSYEQEVREQSWNKWFVGGLGALALGAGIYLARRKRRARDVIYTLPGPGSSLPPPPAPPPRPGEPEQPSGRPSPGQGPVS